MPSEPAPGPELQPEFPPNYAQDELGSRIRHELFLRPEQTTFTFRNKMNQTALPIRDWGSFMPPNGLGGGGVQWNRETFRFLPSDFVLRTPLTGRYGASFLPEDMTIQDWGVTYDDLEPHYDHFEYLCGTSGTAGNLRGQIQGKHATGVSFVDTGGVEWEQPADLVILSAYTMFNVQLLLHSKIGKPYDPIANAGVIGRNFTHQTISSVNGFFDNKKFNFNPFISSGAIGMCIDEFNGDNFDHGPHGFVGGAYMGQVQTNGRPIQTTPVPPGTPKWGAAWKSAVRDNYLSSVKPGTGIHGSFYSYRDVYLDLDPTYKDRFGRPLMRMTIDFHDNEIKQNAFLTDKFAEIIHAMGAHTVDKQYRKGPYDATDYQTTHLNCGAIICAYTSTSSIYRYLQSWDRSNLVVTGTSAVRPYA